MSLSKCVICLGESGKPLSGKRCTASRCKAEYALRLKAARLGDGGGGSDAGSATPTLGAGLAAAVAEAADGSLVGFKLWEIVSIYGRRDYDPEKLSSYELRNGISPDREKELALLAFAHYKEDANDGGRSVHGWISLRDIIADLSDNELNVLDHFMQNNPSAEWTRAREALREEFPLEE